MPHNYKFKNEEHSFQHGLNKFYELYYFPCKIIVQKLFMGQKVISVYGK